MPTVAVQFDLFGRPSDLPGFHVVAAHTRIQADGTEVFVAEHLRLNRGTSPHAAGRANAQAATTPDASQMSLFHDAAPSLVLAP